MKIRTKILLKLSPKYLNKIEDLELTEEIVMYALENGFDYKDDTYDRYSQFEKYVKYIFFKDKKFINFYVESKCFNIENISTDIVDYIKNNNINLLIRCIERNIECIKFLDGECNFKEINQLFSLLELNNINYNNLNEEFLKDNISLALKYLEKDFSNIINLKKYNKNYLEDSAKITNIFFSNIRDNIFYLNEVNELFFSNTEKQKIINTIKEIPILVNENTPKFIYNDKEVIYNLILKDLSNANFISENVNFDPDERDAILKKIIDEKYIFKKMPKCFTYCKEIKKSIIFNNPYIIDTDENFEFSFVLEYYFNMILEGKYKINDNTSNVFLKILLSDYLIGVLEKDFDSIKYFIKLNVRWEGNQDKLYEILKNNDYRINGSLPLLLQDNEKLIKEGLETKTLDINTLDLLKSNYSEEFKLYLVNYTIDNNIQNDVIEEWEKVIKKESYEITNGRFYIKNISLLNAKNIPEGITEIFYKKNDIDSVNLLIDKVKNNDTDVKKIVIYLSDYNFTNEELKSIKDKTLVEFCSIDGTIRFSVDEMIEKENTLDLMVKDIKESSLSPYERFLAVYFIVTNFKEYKNVEDDKSNDIPRNLYMILNNDYIVCVGYSMLLQNLLKRVGIDSVKWSLEALGEGHSQIYCNIKDEKYGLNGFYMSDPTWDSLKYSDNVSNNTSYMHETTKKTRACFYIKKDKDGKPLLNDEIFNDFTNEEMLNYLKYNYKYFEEKISKLDPNFYNLIKGKKVTIELATIVNDYFKTKINKPIDQFTEAKAMFELEQFIYGKIEDKEERDKRWNDFIIEKAYSLELLTENYLDRIEIISEELKNMKIKDYNTILSKMGRYNKMCFEEAYIKLKNFYFKNENSIIFSMICRDNSNISFLIYIDDKLYENNKVEEVFNELNNKGYKIILDKNFDKFEIILDKSYQEKTIIELFSILGMIKQDYLDVYNNVWSNGLKI